MDSNDPSDNNFPQFSAGNRRISVTDASTRTIGIVLLALALSLTFGFSSANAETIVFFDQGFDSALVHNRIAGFVALHGFGYDVDYLFAETVPGMEGMRRGDLDVSLEMWPNNLREIWDSVIADGSVIDLGLNLTHAPQGWYVPTYMIEGDAERGIEPVAPDLRSVSDLPDYWELFRDPENPRKGRLHNGPIGWVISEQNVMRLEGYGLDEQYDIFHTGSQAALDSSLMRAYERGEPWVGYYWEPTWIMGLLDMTMIEEPPHTEACWHEEDGDFACAFPTAPVHVAVTASMLDRAPEYVEFLRNYETELHHLNSALAYMQTTDGDIEDAALWFLREYEDLWTPWLEPDTAAKVKDALDAL